jgi:Fur family peroxide stress response transcriptional regulator
MAHPPPTLADLEERCQSLGIPMTLQRRAILEVLASRTDHPTADEVLAELERRIDGVSRATVYRMLETLVQHGLLVRVCHPGAAARYDMKLHRHHHLVCDACGRIIDVEAPHLDGLALPDVAPEGFRVRDFSVHIRGLCIRCAPREDRKPRTQKEEG